MKKLLLTLFTAAFTLNAAAEIIEGNCGSNITWTYDTETYTLTFDGSGQMEAHTSSSSTSWGKEVLFTYTITEGRRVVTKEWTILNDVGHIVFKGTITNIAENSFTNADLLEKVTLTSSITSIGEDAFSECYALSDVDGDIANDITIGNDAFKNTNLIDLTTGALYLGKTLIKVYSGNPEDGYPSKKFDFEVANGTTKICDKAFANNTMIKSISIPESVTSFGKDMFQGCTLTDNNPNDDFLMAGDYVIVKADKLTEGKYTISSDVKFIAEDAFDGCNNLKFIECKGTQAPQTTKASLPTTDYTTIVTKGYESNFNKFKNVNTTKISLTANKLTTCTFLHDAQIPNGIAVYRAEVDNNNKVINLIKLNPDHKSINIQKGQGVILKSYNANGEFTFNQANSAEAIDGRNDIKPCLDDTPLIGNENAFGIKTIEGKQHFIKINSATTIPVGKAYIQGNNGTADQIRFNYENPEEEEAWETNIEDINAGTSNNSRIFNMAGQRLSSAQNGLNIIDGKIVIK